MCDFPFAGERADISRAYRVRDVAAARADRCRERYDARLPAATIGDWLLPSGSNRRRWQRAWELWRDTALAADDWLIEHDPLYEPF